MSTNRESSVPAPSGKPAIIWACALGAPASFFLLVAAAISAYQGALSYLTLPNGAIRGACFGAGAGGLVALLCGCHLRRGFCYLFGAALGAVASIILSQWFVSIPSDDSRQLLIDAFVLDVIFMGLFGGAAARRFVTQFGAKSRAWAGISAGISAGAVLPLVTAGAFFADMKAQAAPEVQYPFSAGHVLAEAFAGACVHALIVAVATGLIAALAGAIRDSAVRHRVSTPKGTQPLAGD